MVVDGHLDILVHPLVLLNISDYIIRVKHGHTAAQRSQRSFNAILEVPLTF